MSDVALAQQQQLTNPNPKAAAKLTPRQRKAVDCMIWEGMTYQEAALAAGLSTRAMRLALTKPHVMAYLRSERQVLRESHGPRNIHRLAAIRDAADNMPAVNAIKALEQLGEYDGMRGNSAANRSPGMIIQIINQSQQTPHYQQIEAKPLQSNAFGPTDGVGRDE